MARMNEGTLPNNAAGQEGWREREMIQVRLHECLNMEIKSADQRVQEANARKRAGDRKS